MDKLVRTVASMLVGAAVLAAAGLAPVAIADGAGAQVNAVWAADGSSAGGSAKPRPDFSGLERVGVASFYGKEFFGRQMANGAPMDPSGINAASRTLPLGTTARVTNLDSGKSAVVRIEDRGPYVKGRIVDLSPHTARKIGITRRQGLGRVVVAPITVPLPDGRVKLGAAARDSGTGAKLRLASTR